MSTDDILTLIAGIFLLLGAFLSLAAGVGLVRFHDVPSRLHAATKPQILGLLFVLTAIALEAQSWSTLLAVAPVLVFQMLTAPISAHMVARAGYRTGNLRKDELLVDDLGEAIDRVTRTEDDAVGDMVDPDDPAAASSARPPS
ncbi:multisubunit sodium/proton antiporter MrpG subunit [Glaciihabitans tibetensis]|uniref:Multisubunit sodium/proton antiporter MrpG subunit n=1 Tax=Glaciihabitans tibetensis TaxID=1266600 RepID=A0A2T0VFP6_9MICO|nr:monovalent cation/H(+) antiporter subunit G [Glaciihabitans tibetensis]PRY69021.1 multisubunit sodium/proton antiporter MrpG subunit [Glaciihabitans tibetensis]